MSRKARDPAWAPVAYDLEHVDAFKALHAGTANEHQQRLALVWIVKTAAETHTEPFRSDADGGDRETSFALGRAFVGRQILKLVDMPPKILSEMRKNNG